MSKRLEDLFQQEVQRRQQKQQKPDGGKFGRLLLIVVPVVIGGYVIHQVRAGSNVGSVVDPPGIQTEPSKPAKPKPPVPNPLLCHRAESEKKLQSPVSLRQNSEFL